MHLTDSDPNVMFLVRPALLKQEKSLTWELPITTTVIVIQQAL